MPVRFSAAFVVVRISALLVAVRLQPFHRANGSRSRTLEINCLLR